MRLYDLKKLDCPFCCKTLICVDTNIDEDCANFQYWCDDCGVDIDITKSSNELAYSIYLEDFYKEHDKNEKPVCFDEFCDNEWQDEETQEFYFKEFDKVRS